MLPGTVFAGRFDVERLAGTGGMAKVYRAIDRETGTPVALKILSEHGDAHVARFQREAALLGELTHPAIVRLVAHGVAGDAPYLALEWLDGETLAEVLRRRALGARESVDLARRVAEGLGAAHARGIIHRDVKPSNLLLVDGSVERVKILDFGIARITQETSMTRTGAMIGTPGYMAPEQARGDRAVDARADVFSLGCVLFECLAGRPPFYGENFIAVLAKILVEDVPRLRALQPHVSAALDELVAELLAKNVEARPRDGSVVARALGALVDIGSTAPDPNPLSESQSSLTVDEQRLLSVVLAGSDGAPTWAEEAAFPPTLEQPGGSLSDVRAAVARFGGRLERMLDGSVLATFFAQGTATDQVVAAARCALAMHELLPASHLAVATGRGKVAHRLPVGEVIDRVVALAEARSGVQGVRLDETTSGLLDTRFVISGDAGGLFLVHEREAELTVRTLLGKPVPCVGRERELATLQGVLEECFAEPVARVVLVTGPVGVGKSRLRSEMLGRIRGRDDRVEIWMGRGDPMSAGSPFGLIAQAIRHAAGVRAGEALDVRRRKLRARAGRHVAAEDAGRVSDFLGELTGTSFVEEPRELDAPQSAPPSRELAAARRDPRLMGDQIRRAFEDFVVAECAAQPVVLVLEDLHWGDLPTVQLVDGALRHARDLPFFVLALGRPEITTQFPKLWEARDVQPLVLRELKRSSCEKLVRDVLGEAATAEVVDDLVTRAAGNAFYLEELIRAVAEGKGSSLPETVFAMVQARLEALETEARQVLRAASVFGQAFWAGGVAALLGGGDRTSSTLDWLMELTRREVFTERRESAFPGQREYVFRHALVRETAYEMLTEEDRALGHRLAAGWLASVGGADAVVLAEHLERGGVFEEAIGWWSVAAEQALEGNDLAAVVERARRGELAGAGGDTLGHLLVLAAEAHGWRGDAVESAADARRAMERVLEGSGEWLRAAAALAQALGRLGDAPGLLALAELYLTLSPGASDSGPYALAGARIAAAILPMGRLGEADRVLAVLRAIEADVKERDLAAYAWVQHAKSWRAMMAGDLAACIGWDLEVAAAFSAIGDLRFACEHRANVGYDLCVLGAFEQAEVALRECLQTAERLGVVAIVPYVKHNLGLALARLGHVDEAARIERDAVIGYHEFGDRRMEGAARQYLSDILFLMGDLAGAEEEVRRSIDLLDVSPPFRAGALAHLARVLVRSGRVAEAITAALEAKNILESLESTGEGDVFVVVALAEALLAAGDEQRARAALAEARARLFKSASKILDEDRRASFLLRIPEHAMTLELARLYLDGGAPTVK